MNQVTIEMLEKLPERETKRRAELEGVIKTDLKAFLRVGAALAEICRDRLYRSSHHTYEEYLADVWDLGKTRGYQLIDAHKVVQQLEPVRNDSHGLSTIVDILLPQNEAQVRPLVKFKDDPEKLAAIWRQTVTTAPEGRITAKHVQQTIFDVVGRKAKEGTGKIRAAVNKDELLSKEFKDAFATFLQEIERAKLGKYKTTSREAILNHLDALRETVAHDGETIPDHAIKNKTDRSKLLEGGFRILRKNPDNLCVEEQTAAGFWELLYTCRDEEELTSIFNQMMREDSNLRG